MSFSEPKWRERVEFNETETKRAGRIRTKRRIERSLKNCDRLELNRLTSGEKQRELGAIYKAEVAYKSTKKTLDDFRGKFGVQYRLDAAKRPCDRDYDVRLYTFVDKDYWTNGTLREWYNNPKGGDGGGSTAIPDPKRTRDMIGCNKHAATVPAGYMVGIGGALDPSGQTAAQKYNRQLAAKQTRGGSGTPKPKLNIPMAPHWGHWQQNLDYSRNIWDQKRGLGLVKPAPGEPWATGY